MTAGSATRWVLLSILLSGISGCGLFDPPLDVRAIQSPAGPVLAPDDTLYQAAARAIVKRDYGLALDYLQAARQKLSADVRVLNAFGVIYDKLGRFDLSARYYAEAKKLDPGSAIVAANLAYSARLQGKAELPLPGSEAVATLPTLSLMTAAAAPASGSVSIAQPENPAVPPLPTAPGVTIPRTIVPVESVILSDPKPAGNCRTPASACAPAAASLPRSTDSAVNDSPETKVAARETVNRIGEELTPSRGAVPPGKPLLTGGPLMIVNASGQPGATEPVRRNLASKGWTAPRSAMSDGASQPDTTIRFALSNAIVARGLARTLPFPSRLLRCESQCGLRLTLGRDFLSAPVAKHESAPVKQG